MTCSSFVSGFVVLLASTASAAPPVLTYLYPAGAGRGQTVEITAGGTIARWPTQGWASERGVSLKPLPAKGKLSVTVAADARPGVCWIRLHDEEGASALKPFVIGTLPEIVEQEPNDDAKKPQMVDGSGVVVNGRLGMAGDVDCFGVRLRKGQTLVADVDAHELLGSPMDAILQLLSADGFVLKENNDDHGLDPRIVFTAPADGLYVLRLFAFPSDPDSSIRFAGGETYVYRLTLTTGPFADHAFPLAVSRQGPFDVQPSGWNLPEPARKLTVKPDDADEAAVFGPALVRPLRVRVESHPCLVEQKPNDRERPQAIELPVTVSGRIDPPGDIDVYRFAAKKGQPLLFQVESHALGFPLDPVLRLTDAKGKLLLEQDDTGQERDASLSYTPSADGAFHIEVRDLHGHGGSRYVYRLRALFPEPGFALTVKADRFATQAGKPLDIPVTIERRNGCKEEIEILAEGLPEGVTAMPVKSKQGGPASINLKVTAGKGPLSVPFRIVAKTKGRSRTASVAGPGVAASLAHLWLTVK